MNTLVKTVSLLLLLILSGCVRHTHSARYSDPYVYDRGYSNRYYSDPAYYERDVYVTPRVYDHQHPPKKVPKKRYYKTPSKHQKNIDQHRYNSYRKPSKHQKIKKGEPLKHEKYGNRRQDHVIQHGSTNKQYKSPKLDNNVSRSTSNYKSEKGSEKYSNNRRSSSSSGAKYERPSQNRSYERGSSKKHSKR